MSDRQHRGKRPTPNAGRNFSWENDPHPRPPGGGGEEEGGGYFFFRGDRASYDPLPPLESSEVMTRSVIQWM
jgi:hypothetical protein